MRRIGIIGASGRTGQLAVKEVLRKGWQVNAQVRNPDVLSENPDVRAIIGNPDDPAVMKELISGSDAILFLLNISRKTDWPWSSLRAPETLLSDSMKVVVNEAPPGFRVISCSAWGVRDSWSDMPGWFRWLVRHSNIGIAYEDHGRQEEILLSSRLNYTIVRPVGLTNAQEAETIRTSQPGEPVGSMMIPRKAVASFMAEAIDDPNYFGRILTLSKGNG